MGQIATIFGIIVSMGAAYMAANFNNIMDFLQLIFAFVNAPLFATFLLGMFWKRATGNAAFIGLLPAPFGAAIHHGLTLPAGAHAGIKGGWLGHVVHTYPSEMAQNFWTAIFRLDRLLRRHDRRFLVQHGRRSRRGSERPRLLPDAADQGNRRPVVFAAGNARHDHPGGCRCSQHHLLVKGGITYASGYSFTHRIALHHRRRADHGFRRLSREGRRCTSARSASTSTSGPAICLTVFGV